MRINTIIKDRKYWFLAILFIVLLYPYFLWGMLSNSIYETAIGLLLALIVYFGKKELTGGEQKLVFFYVIVCLKIHNK